MTEQFFSANLFIYLLVPAAFILGSVPFGIIFSKKSGIDVRQTGSKNIGATNVLRSVGKLPAILTLFADILKGAIPLVVFLYTISDHQAGEIWKAAIGLSAVLGHMFSLFLSFKGGKGVATGFGVLLIYSPLNALVISLVWIVVVYTTKYVSLGAIIAVSSLPFIFMIQRSSMVNIVFAILLAILIVFKHRSNISNLLSGTESKLGSKG